MDETADAGEGGYRSAHAEFYHHHVGDRGDVDFYTELATRAEGPTLELACGTGRIYLETLRADVDADGIDLSADALDVLRENAAAEDLEPSVWRADMADFSTDRTYALATCPFNAVQHLRSVEEQLSLLESVYDALVPGGAFVFDVFVPSFEVIRENYGEWQRESVDYRGRPHEVATRTQVVDEVSQEFEVETELRDPEGDLVFAECHRLKMLPKREIELLARLSSFPEQEVTGGFDPSFEEDLADGDGIQVWRLWKEEE